MIETSHITPCVAFRGRAEGESEAARGQRMTGELETGIERLDPETVMAVVAEPVPGVTSGMVPAVPGYYRRTREICARHGGLPNLNKGICGMGRTETLFACNQDGIAPDIGAIAKGLGTDSQPVGAMLRTANHRSGQWHLPARTHPYGPSDRRRADGPDPAGPGRAARAGADHGRKDRGGPALAPWRAPHVGDIRGQDLFRGIERPKDRASRPLSARAQVPYPDRGRRFRGRAALPSDGRHH